MPPFRFVYNPKTLRFEKAGIAWYNLWFTGISLLVTGFLFFAVFLFLQNRWVETPLEKSLRSENAALSKHRLIVQKELDASNVLLSSLSNTDRALHKRIFLTDQKPVVKTEGYSKEILASTFADFYQWIDKLKVKTSKSFEKALAHNGHFSGLYWPGKKDIQELDSYPTLAPLADFKLGKLACGFGNHINPFNKLLYEHNGIDLAGEKGTSVFATGSGKITVAAINDLPNGFGNYIEIDHGNGYVTRYAHLLQLNVFAGQKVAQGQVIGTIGMSGGAISPHVHYEIIKNRRYCNPVLFMIEQDGVESFMALTELSKTTQQALD